MTPAEMTAYRKELRRLLIDAALYANDARIAGRRDITAGRFATLLARLTAAKIRIDRALEIVQMLDAAIAAKGVT